MNARSSVSAKRFIVILLSLTYCLSTHDDPAPVSTNACVGIFPLIITFIMLFILFKGFLVKLLHHASAVPTFETLTGRSLHVLG